MSQIRNKGAVKHRGLPVEVISNISNYPSLSFLYEAITSTPRPGSAEPFSRPSSYDLGFGSLSSSWSGKYKNYIYNKSPSGLFIKRFHYDHSILFNSDHSSYKQRFTP